MIVLIFLEKNQQFAHCRTLISIYYCDISNIPARYQMKQKVVPSKITCDWLYDHEQWQ